MIQFFRNHSSKVVWVIIVIFLLTMFSGLLLKGVYSGRMLGRTATQHSSEGVVATVGDYQVGHQLYDHYLSDDLYLFQASRPFQKPSPEILEMLQMDALSKSVQYLVMLNGAHHHKIKVTRSEFEQHMASLMTQFGFKSKSELKKKLKERHMSYGDFEDSQEDDLMVQKFMGFLQSKVTVSDADVDHQYTDVDVQHILFRITPTRSVAETVSVSRAVKLKIDRGLDFGEAARLYSDDVESKNLGGHLGWLSPNVLPEMFEMMHSLHPGQVSQPFLTRYGYHLIKVVAKRDRVRPLDLNYDREKQVILNQKRQQVSDAYMQTELSGKQFQFNEPFLEGHHHKREGKLNEALGAYQRAVSVMPNSPLPHYYIAQIKVAQHHLDLAKEELLKASVKGELNPALDLPGVHMVLAQIYAMQKDAEHVRLSLDRALALSQNDYLAMQQLKPFIQKFGSSAQQATFHQYVTPLESKITALIKAEQAKNSSLPANRSSAFGR